MTTFLSKLFKPKWQSKNATTRLQAIQTPASLGPNAQNILQSLAESDPEPKVRQQALLLVNDAGFLLALHKKSDAITQKLIEHRLTALAKAQSLTLFDLIPDATVLTHMILQSAEPDQFLVGLAHIEDTAALCRIALGAKTSRMRQAAAELIETEAQLTELAQQSKHRDKQVYRIAKAKLDAIKAQQQEIRQREEQAQRILVSLRELASTESMLQFEARLKALIQRWHALEHAQTTVAQSEFEALSQKCTERWQALESARQHEEEQLRLQQSGDNEQQATLQTLRETLQRFQAQAASELDLSALDALIKTQENRWLEAARHNHVDKAENKQYQALMTELRHYHAALQSLCEFGADIDRHCATLSSPDLPTPQLERTQQQLRQLLQKIDWPENFVIPARLEQVSSVLGHAADIKKQHAQNTRQICDQIEKLIEELDAHLAERQVKASNACHKQIQSLLTQLNQDDSARLHSKLTLRVKQLHELRDWQGLASEPRQLELVEAMEQLSRTSIDPSSKLERIQAMQKEWKTLGGARDAELWQRFKTASDLAYEPVKIWQEEQSRLMANHLEKRKTLVSQLQEFITGNDWQHADWRAVEQINKRARQEWKDAFPVVHRDNRSVQQQFDTLLKQLDQYLNAERDRNEQLKNCIISEAQTLLSRDDIGQAIEQAKALQKRWQQIGICHFKSDRALWQSFRETCDQIFARRDQEREQRKEESSRIVAAAEELLAQMQQFLAQCPQLTVQAINDAQQDFRKQYKQLPDLPKKEQDALRARFEALLDQLKVAQKQKAGALILDQWHEALRKSALCHALYQAPANADKLADEFTSKVELAGNLEQQFAALWQQISAGTVPTAQVITADQARNLLIQCEIAAGLASPEADKERRMQLQVSRLSEGFSSGSSALTREQQLGNLLTQWCGKVGLDQATLDAATPRLRAALDKLFAEG